MSSTAEGIQSRPGFDWSRVTWSYARSPPSALCSYCSALISEEAFPLLLWSTRGYAARFCEACMRQYWGFAPLPDGPPRSR